jgi:hypothetical protein
MYTPYPHHVALPSLSLSYKSVMIPVLHTWNTFIVTAYQALSLPEAAFQA